MVDLVKSLTEVIDQLKMRSRLSILDNWQIENEQGSWETLPTVNSKQNKPMVAFLQCEQNIHLRQAWQVPNSYAGLSTLPFG
jgi:alpha-mannosidase